MLSWIFKKTSLQFGASCNESTSSELSSDERVDMAAEFIQPLHISELLALPRRQKLLAHIWQRTSVSRKQFDTLYLKPIERYAALVQQFPASEAHHHAYSGGMLDHGLEIMAYALKLRQSYLLPIGSTPEEQAAQSEVWTAATAYAALLHDIGKIAVDLHVEYRDEQIWHPWHGPLRKPYRFKYRKDREYRLHSACAGLLYHQVLDTSILDWLSQTQELWAALLYILAGQFEYAGVLGEIVTKADQSSVAQELGGDPAKAMAAPKHALQRKLLDGLRYLVKEQLKLNNAGPSDGWLTDEALWLVSKTVCDKLRGHLLSQGISGIPNTNTAIFDVLQEHSMLTPTADNKAIWSATVSSDTGWKNSFTFFKIVPALIWDADDRPEVFAGSVIVNSKTPVATTSENETMVLDTTETILDTIPTTKPASLVQTDSLDVVFDLLGLEDSQETLETPQVLPQPDIDSTFKTDAKPKKAKPVKQKAANLSLSDNGLLSECPENSVACPPPVDIQELLKPIPKVSANNDSNISGEHFMQWLKGAILGKKLIINDAKALVHTVENSIYLVTPGIFMRYCAEFPEVQKLAKAEDVSDWRYMQRVFEKLKRHKKQDNGLNIWTCAVTGPHRTKQVHGYLLAKPEIILPEIPFNNPYLNLIDTTKNE